MLDLDNLSSNGIKFMVIHEDPATSTLEQQFRNNEDLGVFLFGGAAAQFGPDLVKLDTVYAIVNTQRGVMLLSPEQHKEWKAKEPRDWFHRPSMFDVLEALLGNGESEFTGPTAAQSAKYATNSVAIAISNEDTDCGWCLVDECLVRHGPFNEISFDAEISRRMALLN